MNVEESSQRQYWTYPVLEWRSEQEQQLFKECIWFIHELEPKCGLASNRKAFVTAAHYFHRYFAVHSIENSPTTNITVREEEENVLTSRYPRLVAFTCLFIAGKTEEVPWPKYTHGSLQCRGYRAEKMCAAVDGLFQMDELMLCERDVLETLGFFLVVHQTKPRPKPGSNDEKKETILLMTTKYCVTKTPEEMGLAIQAVNDDDVLLKIIT